MRLSAAACYALAAAAQLQHGAQSPPIPCSMLAKAGDMPERFLLQVLKRLVDDGILKSTRGVYGGYYLARPAQEITAAEIVESIDGPLVEKLDLPEGLAPNSVRLLTRQFEEIGREARARLAAIRLSDLQAAPRKRPAKVAS